MDLKTISKIEAKIGCVYELTGIPMCICDSKGDTFLYYPQLKFSPPSDILLDFITLFHQQTNDHKYPLIVSCDPGFFICIAQLEDDLYLALGPISFFRIDKEALWKIYRDILPDEYLIRLCYVLKRTPLVTYKRFTCAISLIIELFSGKCISCKEISLSNNPIKFTHDEYHARKMPSIHREDRIIHENIVSYENAICTAVECGNPELLKKRSSYPSYNSIPITSENLLLQHRYSFIAFLTLVIRAAIRGGLTHGEAFSLGEVYCLKLEKLSYAEEIETLTYKMTEDFCNRVKSTQMGNRYSPVIRKCRNYIHKHLYEKIHVEDLAQLCGVSTRTISIRFKKDLNTSVPEYINKEKLKEAQYLLANSNFSLSEISTDLHFSSQSYFTKIFRKEFDCTPLQYRKQHKHL